jgi:hypothetical protein
MIWSIPWYLLVRGGTCRTSGIARPPPRRGTGAVWPSYEMDLPPEAVRPLSSKCAG